jgi:hypothetical protein
MSDNGWIYGSNSVRLQSIRYIYRRDTLFTDILAQKVQENVVPKSNAAAGTSRAVAKADQADHSTMTGTPQWIDLNEDGKEGWTAKSLESEIQRQNKLEAFVSWRRHTVPNSVPALLC